ncbi:hypothetical protein CHUAL_002611 [Chamberlinius hualienensis]
MANFKDTRLRGPLVLVVFSILRTMAMPTEEIRCLTCNDYNREKKENICVNSHVECGACLQGLIESSDDQRICVKVEVLDHPQDVFEAEEDTDIDLKCLFNHCVTCFWIHNDREVEVDHLSRYQYVNERNRTNCQPSDCSITIKQLAKHDEGEWKCGGWINSHIDPIISSVATVKIKDSKDHLKEIAATSSSYPTTFTAAVDSKSIVYITTSSITFLIVISVALCITLLFGIPLLIVYFIKLMKSLNASSSVK